MKYYIFSIGCQMNKSDSERIASVLESLPAPACACLRRQADRQAGAGWNSCSKEEDADLIVVVACSVRQSAVDRIFGRSSRFKKYKKKNPKLKTILTGCVLDLDKKKLAERFDMVCDIREIGRNLPLTPSSKEWEARSLPLEGRDRVGLYSYLSITPKYSSDFHAYVPIMTGCNNFCSYCVVPYTRGREYSRPVRDILTEVKNLIAKEYKEITLIGQNVNSYNSGITPSILPCKGEKQKTPILNKEGSDVVNFPTLLRLINSIPGDFWIRFFTSHPKDMSDELIDAIAECEKVCPYIHLPIQAGSNKILKAMNRKYTKGHYLNLIKKIRKKIPDVMLSTDVIVGFPDETEKDFKETVDVFKKVKFSMAYIAKYSPRAGTAAFRLEDNIAPLEKIRREHVLTDILRETALENNKKFIGKTIRVLIDRQSENMYFGKTAQFVNTKIRETENETARNVKICQFADVKITNATSFGMEGKITAFMAGV
ncbi:MAG: tRNA (N6-isopentenyl adenosine(37)-C2)-methylthiotransferase MiaB [bacterium]